MLHSSAQDSHRLHDPVVQASAQSGLSYSPFRTPAYHTPGTGSPQYRHSSEGEQTGPSVGSRLILPKEEDRHLPLVKLFENLEACPASCVLVLWICPWLGAFSQAGMLPAVRVQLLAS